MLVDRLMQFWTRPSGDTRRNLMFFMVSPGFREPPFIHPRESSRRDAETAEKKEMARGTFVSEQNC